MNPPSQVGRNQPCPCGSGQRFKHCCGALAARSSASAEAAVVSTDASAADKTRMGLAYLTADGVAGEPDRGIRLVDEAAAAGDGLAAAIAATVRATGLWGRLDWPTALDYLERAARFGHRPSQEALRILAAGPQATPDTSDDWAGLRARLDLRSWLAVTAAESLNEKPPIRCLQGFIPAAACDWLVSQVSGRLARASIYDRRTGGDVLDERRKNSQADLGVANMGLLTFVIRARIAALLSCSDVDMEIPRVLHYAPGETFAPHYDYLTPDEPAYAAELAHRGQRAETFLIYLNEDYEGGETAFTDLALSHRGAKGDALWFSNLDDSGAPDPDTRHAGLPPTSGEKWLFSQWVRQRR